MADFMKTLESIIVALRTDSGDLTIRIIISSLMFLLILFFTGGTFTTNNVCWGLIATSLVSSIFHVVRKFKVSDE
jgi:hypothetical protein